MRPGPTTALVPIATAGALLLAAAPAAHAYVWSIPYYDGSVHTGTGYWSDDPSSTTPGDAIRACDIWQDGWGIETQLDIDPGSTFHADRVASTAGHAFGYCTPWKTGNIAEGTDVWVRVCQVKGSRVECGISQRLGA